MKTLREYIDKLDEIDRRGFLKGMGAAAVVGATGGVKAGYPGDREVKGAHDMARAKSRGAAGLPYDGPNSGYPGDREIKRAYDIARAQSKGATNQEETPAQRAERILNTPRSEMEADTAYRIAIAKKRGAAGLPLNMPDVTMTVGKDETIEQRKERMLNTPRSHLEILDAYNMARAEAGIRPIPREKIKEQDLEEASPDAVKRIEQLVRYK
jgi:hypothetical protein